MPAGLSIEPILDVVWASGCLVSIAAMMVSLRRLSRLTAEARPLTDARWLALAQDLSSSLNVRGGVTLWQTAPPTAVGTFGWRRPAVLLPAQCDRWSDDRIRVVLGHELAHIRRADWASVPVDRRRRLAAPHEDTPSRGDSVGHGRSPLR